MIDIGPGAMYCTVRGSNFFYRKGKLACDQIRLEKILVSTFLLIHEGKIVLL